MIVDTSLRVCDKRVTQQGDTDMTKLIKDHMNNDVQFDRFFVLTDNRPMGYFEVTGKEFAVFNADGKFIGYRHGKKAAIEALA